jgi:predicted membrane protein
MANRRVSTQALVGLLIVLVGVALLLNTTGLYETGSLLQYVPSLFVVAGLYALVTSGFRNVFGPLVVVTLAGAWQLVTLGYVESSDVVSLWPVLLILFGLSVALGRIRPKARTLDNEDVSLFALFAGQNRRVTTGNFRNAEMTVLFGGTELDLRDAAVADPPARINATVLFGGADVIVPRDWNVDVDVFPLFGGAEDERPRREGEHEQVDLVVTGFAAFGGVSIKD